MDAEVCCSDTEEGRGLLFFIPTRSARISAIPGPGGRGGGMNSGGVVRLLSPPDRELGDGEIPPVVGGRANRLRLYGKLVRKKERS